MLLLRPETTAEAPNIAARGTHTEDQVYGLIRWMVKTASSGGWQARDERPPEPPSRWQKGSDTPATRDHFCHLAVLRHAGRCCVLLASSCLTSQDAVMPVTRAIATKEQRNPMKTDLEIARAASLKPIDLVAEEMGLTPDLLEPYGRQRHENQPRRDRASWRTGRRPSTSWSRAITPTPLGEGKTTTTVGLGQAFSHIGKRATVAIRQPSMGPTFGIKGGAAGGGYSQVVPMEHAQPAPDRRLPRRHRGAQPAVGDARQPPATRATSSASTSHNITWRRVLDVNDRALRNIVDRPRRQGGRRPPPDRLRHHRRLRGHGDPGAGRVAGRTCARGSAGSSSATPTTASRSPPSRLGRRRRRWP